MFVQEPVEHSLNCITLETHKSDSATYMQQIARNVAYIKQFLVVNTTKKC